MRARRDGRDICRLFVGRARDGCAANARPYGPAATRRRERELFFEKKGFGIVNFSGRANAGTGAFDSEILVDFGDKLVKRLDHVRMLGGDVGGFADVGIKIV